MEKNSEKIIARLFLLGNTISNTTEGVYDGSYNISQIVGSSGVNQAYSYDIDFVSDEKIDISDILDIDVKIKLRDENSTSKREREIYGKVFKAQEISIEGKKLLYRIKLVSPFHYLFCNNRYKIYQNKTIIDIITEIIGMSNHILNLQVINKLDSMQFPQREFCTQYDQSDAEFILMLAQEEKISIIFDSSDNNPYKMILLDINSHAPVIDSKLRCNFNLSKSFSSTHFVASHYNHELPSTDHSNKVGNKIANSHFDDNQTSSQLRQDIKVEKVRDRIELHQGGKSSRFKSLYKVKFISKFC